MFTKKEKIIVEQRGKHHLDRQIEGPIYHNKEKI
jgi:hypothetical protein